MNRKGLSPLIAVIILIAIVVIISTMLLNWTSIFTSDQTSDISNTSKQLTNCGVLSIEDVYLDFPTNRSRILVKSSIEDIVEGAELLTRSGMTMPRNTRLPLEIDKGRIAVIEFNLTSNFTACTNFSQAVISTKCTTMSFDQTPNNC